MRTVLIAVDDTAASKAVLPAFFNQVMMPEEVILLHVERLEGKSLMIDMLGEAEMSTLRESVKGTGHKEALDKRADKVLAYYKEAILSVKPVNIKTVIREGNPAAEILKVSEEEGAELIILGNGWKKGLGRLIEGSVTRHVEGYARVPVLVARGIPVCEQNYSWTDVYAAVTVSTAVILGLFLLSFILQSEIHLP